MRCRVLLVVMASLVLPSIVFAREGEGEKSRSWRSPCVWKWSDEEIILGGIEPSQVQYLYVWSMEGEEIVWYAQCKRRKDYHKRSRSSFVTTSYGKLHPEWEQLYPFKGDAPREIREGEVIFVSISWAYPFMFGMRGDSRWYYFKKRNGKFVAIIAREGKVAQYDQIALGNKAAKQIHSLIFRPVQTH
jgi:hypothetical protein